MEELATRENMRKYAGLPGVFAYSPTTGEQYSATPGDYFWLPEGEVLTDSDGEPMVLARQVVQVVSAAEYAQRVMSGDV
jgi:hypothetical protein